MRYTLPSRASRSCMDSPSIITMPPVGEYAIGNDIEQRGLARTVSAQQAVNFIRLKRHADMLQRVHPAKGLRHVPDFNAAHFYTSFYHLPDLLRRNAEASRLLEHRGDIGIIKLFFPFFTQRFHSAFCYKHTKPPFLIDDSRIDEQVNPFKRRRGVYFIGRCKFCNRRYLTLFRISAREDRILKPPA